MVFRIVFPLLLLFGLLAAPNAAFYAASDAAALWWTRVLPSLLPYLVSASLLERSGLFFRLKPRIAPLFLLPFGLLGGFPVGARLCGKLYREGALSLRDAQKAAAFCNLPNPVFLFSVVCVGMFRDPKTALPLLLGLYGTALFGLLPLSRLSLAAISVKKPSVLTRELPAAIGDGVSAILNIGGCIVFASVLGALIQETGVFRLFGPYSETADAIVLGLFEMTSGASKIAALSLSLPLRLALCAFLIRFGGLSVTLQSASCLPLSLLRYCLTLFVPALASAFAVFFLTPLFCPAVAVPTFATGAEMLQNTFDLLSVSLSSAFGLLLVFVFTFGLGRQKRTP